MDGTREFYVRGGCQLYERVVDVDGTTRCEWLGYTEDAVFSLALDYYDLLCDPLLAVPRWSVGEGDQKVDAVAVTLNRCTHVLITEEGELSRLPSKAAVRAARRSSSGLYSQPMSASVHLFRLLHASYTATQNAVADLQQMQFAA